MKGIMSTTIEDYKETIERLQKECTEKSELIFALGESMEQIRDEIANFANVVVKASGVAPETVLRNSGDVHGYFASQMDLTDFGKGVPLRIKKVKENAQIPKYQTEGSSGMDLCAAIDNTIIIPPFNRVYIPTGIAIELPRGYEAQIRPRSGLSSKHGITLINCVGTIDSDYRGEIIVPLVNLSNSAYSISSGERIAQMIISRYERASIEEVNELSSTERGAGGFGSTGEK